MKPIQSFVVLLLVFAFTSNAFAICEHERNDYADWNDRCEKLSATSQAIGAVGGLFAMVTFGASMIPCAAATAAASNACRIKDEKKQNLETCEARSAYLAQEAQEAADRAIAAEQARLGRIAQIDEDFVSRRTVILQQYNQMIQDFTKNYTAEGWNMNDPESQELLRTTRTSIERERDQRLDQLETDHRQAISNA